MTANIIDPAAEQVRREIQREYTYFLDDAGSENIYTERIKSMIEQNGVRLIVNLNHLRQKYPQRCDNLLTASFEELQCFQLALKDIVANIEPEYAASKEDFFVGFEGSFGGRHVNPRSLKAKFLGNLVCCEGIVTKCSLVRPKVVRSVHYCPATNKSMERRYTDLTSYDPFPSSTSYPTQDENRNPLETEFGLSTYKDHQTLSIQELPENAPAGQLPRSVDIIADDDLPDRCQPGDRIRVIGVFRCLPNKQQGYTSGTFRTIIIANNIQLMSKESQNDASDADMTLINKFRRMKNIDHFEMMAQSLAPSICGNEEVKRAILSLLLGGVEKVLPNGTRLRGDVNVLLIGDPSVAKSQCLRYVLHSAPRAVATTGRGSSGVGLTAAVTTDQETGERRLEAGAMVLADRGIVCIDEFDKMSDIDRTAIHEVMEQGRVTIAKAGIHAKLNARCAVLAAANPVYGRYDIHKSPMENIGMQDSLLSRFDLCFVLLDEHNVDRDKRIAAHVVNLHTYRSPGEEDGAVLKMGNAIQTLSTLDLNEGGGNEGGGGADGGGANGGGQAPQLYEKNTSWTATGKDKKILTLSFLRKYIALAKQTKPQLSDDAANYIAEKYCDLRDFDEKKSDRERTTPVTARMLETLIRLSTAHAKARLSKQITHHDAEKAFELLYFACFKEKPKERLEDEEKQAAKKRTAADVEDGDEQEGGEDEATYKRSTRTRKGGQDKENEDENADEPDASADIPAAKKARVAVETPAISVDRYKEFRRHLRVYFDHHQSEHDSLPLTDVTQGIQQLAGPASQFTQGEIKAAVERLSDDNTAMMIDDNLVLI